MKDLYIVTLELDEDSIYFTRMTQREAKELMGMLRGYSIPGSVEKITASPGFHDRRALVRTIQDIGNR